MAEDQRTAYIRNVGIDPETFQDSHWRSLPRYPVRIHHAMKCNHRFILGASNDIDRRALEYLLDPPKLWEPEPPRIDRSHITVFFPTDSATYHSSLATQRYLKKEKIRWVLAGEDAESLDEILLEKSDYLISGIVVEDSFPGYFSNI